MNGTGHDFEGKIVELRRELDRIRTLASEQDPGAGRVWSMLGVCADVQLADQSQHVLRLCVGQLQRHGRGLNQDLRPRKVRRFDREVRVADRAFCRSHVLLGNIQRVDRRPQRILLESAETTAQA